MVDISNTKAVVLDYGVGNIASIVNALDVIKLKNNVVSNASDDMLEADVVIIPGVGSFHNGMIGLNERGFARQLQYIYQDKSKLIIGICLGMQLFCRESEESPGVLGLCWIDEKILKFKNNDLKVPHIGWNKILMDEKKYNNQYFYFVHSYYLPFKESYSLSTTEYGIEFTSSFKLENIVGFQFHPEKSQRLGLDLLKHTVETHLC